MNPPLRLPVALMVGGLAALVGLAAPSEPPGPHRDTRGVSLGLFATDPEFDYGPMLGELAARGASDVLLVDPWVQDDVHGTSLARVPGTSPSEATLRRTTRQARALGLRVGWMPIVRLAHRAPGDWRGRIDPPAGVGAWFASYGTALRRAATTAAAADVGLLVIGSELSALERHEERWRGLVADVRARFDGRLAYSANWDRYTEVPFWDAVDVIGVSAYFPDSPGMWARELARMEAFAGDRQLLLTEVGYPAHARAAERPWDEFASEERAPWLQAELLRAFCEAYEVRPGAGYYLWNWFGVGGSRDASHTLRGKPAAGVVAWCMDHARSVQS